MRVGGIRDLDAIAVRGEKKIKPDKSMLIFGAGTCGMASGCGDLMDFARGYLSEKGIEDVIITSVGCNGLCYAEPLVDVRLPGKRE